MNEKQVAEAVLEIIAKAGPQAIEWIDRALSGAKAKRVEEIRTGESHAAAAVEDLKRGR